MSEERQITLATQGGVALLGGFMGKAFGLLFLLVVTRLVEPDIYGRYTLALSFVLLAQGLLNLSVHRAVDYFVPQYLSAGDEEGAAEITRTALVVGAVSSAIGVALLVLAADWIAEIFTNPEIAVLIIPLSLVLPASVPYHIVIAVFNSTKRMSLRVFTRNLTRPIVKLVATIMTVLFVSQAAGLVAGYITGIVVAGVIGWFIAARKTPWVTAIVGKELTVKKLVSYSLPLAFSGVLFSIIGQIDYFVIGYVSSSTEVGQYRVGYQLASNLAIFAASFTPVFKPLIIEAFGDRNEVEMQYQSAARWTTLLTLPPAIVLVVTPTPYLELLFTQTYAVAGTSVAVLSAGYVVNAMIGHQGPFIEGTGRTRLHLLNSVIYIVANLLLDVLLVPKFGIVGAAVGTTLALSLSVALGTLEVYIIDGVHPFTGSLVKLLIAGVVTASIIVAVTSIVPESLVETAAIPPLTIVIFIGAVVAAGSFTEQDEQIAKLFDQKIGVSLFTSLVRRGR